MFSAIPTGKPVNWTRELVICLLLSGSFAIFICIASDKYDNRDARRAESVEFERAIFHGQHYYSGGRLVYTPPWQNRVLFPSLLELGIHIGVFTPIGWYALLRLLFGFAMFVTFWFALRMEACASFQLSGAGLLLLTYCFFCTFSTPFGMTCDFPDAMFITLFIVASLRHKRILLLILSIIAAANRESSAFAGVIWFFLYAADDKRKINWKEAGFGALVSISSYISVIALRYAFGGAQAIKSNTQYLPFRNNFYNVMEFVHHPTPFSFIGLIFCMTVPCLTWILLNREYLTFTHKRLLMAAGAVTVISLVFGNAGDTRIFIPSMVMVIFVAVGVEAVSQLNNRISYPKTATISAG
ncbi:MAG TPA: hypothetical protein VFC63_27575 [Blastocatellia bacterium]|nr:hypothetical protein [Blastocatellia bacterium]